MKINTSILFVLLIFSLKLYAQENKVDSIFEVNLKKKTLQFKMYADFQKTQDYFLEKQWDSTLVSSMRVLSTKNDNQELNDFCHFFRAFSFEQKKVLDEAKNEVSLISKDFYFYPKVIFLSAKISFKQAEYKKTIDLYKQLLEIKNLSYYGIQLSNIENNLGLSYYYIDKYNLAEQYLINSAKKQEKNKDTLLLISCYTNIASNYYDQYKDSLAITYFNKAYKLSKWTDSFKRKFKTAKNMAIVEENRKNFKLALTYKNEASIWKDSLNDQNKIWEVAKVEKEFAVAQKQKEVAFLETQNKLQQAERDLYFYAALALLLLLGTGGYFYREKLKANKIILKQKVALDALNETKDKLFSIVSHDLRSSVNALKTSNSELQNNLQTKNYDQLDRLLSNNSAITNGAYNLLDNLLNWALLQTQQGYFEISSMRLFFIVEHVAYNYKSLLLEKNIQLENAIPKTAFIEADQESLKIILRNFIDNAIKFSNDNGFIKIYTRDADTAYCNLIIEDNGLGMSESTLANLLKEKVQLSKKVNKSIIGTGLGMQLCKEMIAKNKGLFYIESKLGIGTKIIVSLPKKNN